MSARVVNPYQIPAIVEILNGLTDTGNVITGITVTSIVCNTYNFTITYTQPDGTPNILIRTMLCNGNTYY